MKFSQTQPVRPSYDIVDEKDRIAHIASYGDVLNKSFVTDLWMQVINRAINDIAQSRIMRALGIPLKEEDIDNEESAVSFLFNDNHRIPLDDYIVDVICQKCDHIWQNMMSVVSSTDMECPKCRSRSSWKYTIYRITEEQTIREISLKELVSIWGIEDIDLFRKGCERYIELTINKKLVRKQK